MVSKSKMAFANKLSFLIVKLEFPELPAPATKEYEYVPVASGSVADSFDINDV